jgi:hypothetical protein
VAVVAEVPRGVTLSIPLTADEHEMLVTMMVAGGFRSLEGVIYSTLATKATLMGLPCSRRLFDQSRHGKDLDETPETGT